MSIRTTQTDFGDCARVAQERGYVLRDQRRTTLDGSGYTLMPESGGRLRDRKHFSTLVEVSQALKSLPVLGAGSSVHRNLCSEIPMPTSAVRRPGPR